MILVDIEGELDDGRDGISDEKTSKYSDDGKERLIEEMKG